MLQSTILETLSKVTGPCWPVKTWFSLDKLLYQIWSFKVKLW